MEQMKAVKIKLYQNMVNYRMEMSYGYVQTYPLPTPAMVKGMVHALLDLKEYKNLKTSIQGNFASVVTNIQKVYKFDRIRDNKKSGLIDPRPQLNAGGVKRALNRGIMFVDELVDVELLLHISFDEEKLNEQLLDALKQKTVILGRNEDVARVDFVGMTSINTLSTEDEEYELSYNIYLDPKICKYEQLRGTYYRLPFYYESVNSFENKRIFKFIDTVYIVKNKQIKRSNINIDEDRDIVSFISI